MDVRCLTDTQITLIEKSIEILGNDCIILDDNLSIRKVVDQLADLFVLVDDRNILLQSIVRSNGTEYVFVLRNSGGRYRYDVKSGQVKNLDDVSKKSLQLFVFKDILDRNITLSVTTNNLNESIVTKWLHKIFKSKRHYFNDQVDDLYKVEFLSGISEELLLFLHKQLSGKEGLCVSIKNGKLVASIEGVYIRPDYTLDELMILQQISDYFQ